MHMASPHSKPYFVEALVLINDVVQEMAPACRSSLAIVRTLHEGPAALTDPEY
jgi:hypothetical protein